MPHPQAKASAAAPLATSVSSSLAPSGAANPLIFDDPDDGGDEGSQPDEEASAEVYEGARKPSYKLRIDFGPGIGEKKSVGQVAALYTPEDLVGRQVAAVVNFPKRQIGKALSEVLTLGFADEEGRVTLFSPDKAVPNGSRLF